MIAFQNQFITLSYLEEADILIVSWSNSAPYTAVEIENTFDKVIETINKYHCRKLLIDASEANMSMENKEISTALTNFAVKLGETGIEKLARIITSNQSREEGVQSIRSKISLPFQIYDISNREQAIHWLKQS
jgi:hypothetical protein